MNHISTLSAGGESIDGDSDFWEHLLDYIEFDNVLPIVGQGVTTMAPTNDLLYPWLARRLADRLHVSDSLLPDEPSLHDVVCRYLLNGGRQADVYPRLYRILKEDCPDPGETLKQPVSIDKLQLFITTTFDPLLVNELKDSNQHYLILGLDFSDLLMRFFMRTAKQLDSSQAVSRVDFLADTLISTNKNGLVVYFGALDRTVKVIQCDPRAFIAELAFRWHQRMADRQPANANTFLIMPAAKADPAVQPRTPGRIFLSYASEDREAAERLRSGLAAHGLDVWFDLKGLKPATDYAIEIEMQIKQHCCLFLSVISKRTESPGASFFHQERNWAAQTAGRWSDYDRAAFYLPMLITYPSHLCPANLLHQRLLLMRILSLLPWSSNLSQRRRTRHRQRSLDITKTRLPSWHRMPIKHGRRQGIHLDKWQFGIQAKIPNQLI